ncbi:MAG: hypothetical protein ACE5HO_12685 [bacterium]
MSKQTKKPTFWEKAGFSPAVGRIIYSDPADNGYMRGDIYPDGPSRPWEAIQRGSLLYIFDYPGDPLTPGVAATKNAWRLKPEEANSLTHLPTTPVSYGEARQELEVLTEVLDKAVRTTEQALQLLK